MLNRISFFNVAWQSEKRTWSHARHTHARAKSSRATLIRAAFMDEYGPAPPLYPREPPVLRIKACYGAAMVHACVPDYLITRRRGQFHLFRSVRKQIQKYQPE